MGERGSCTPFQAFYLNFRTKQNGVVKIGVYSAFFHSPFSCLSRRQCCIRRFPIFWFWLARLWPFEDFLYALIKVIRLICCEMVDDAQAFAEIFQMPEAPQRDCLVYLPFQYPGFPLTEVVIGLHKGIG